MISKMFYQESYKNLWYEKSPELIDKFDYLLGTMVGDILDRITVSYISDKLDIHFELAKQILEFYEKCGILKKRYIVTCPKCENVLFICDEEEIFDKIQEKPICIMCEDNDYEIENENIFIAFKRLKKSTSSQKEVNETLKKHDFINDVTESKFSLTDSTII